LRIHPADEDWSFSGVWGSFLDPLDQGVDLEIGKLAFRGHLMRLVLNGLNQQALVRVAW
jgi:hypothetical protein